MATGKNQKKKWRERRGCRPAQLQPRSTYCSMASYCTARSLSHSRTHVNMKRKEKEEASHPATFAHNPTQKTATCGHAAPHSTPSPLSVGHAQHTRACISLRTSHTSASHAPRRSATPRHSARKDAVHTRNTHTACPRRKSAHVHGLVKTNSASGGAEGSFKGKRASQRRPTYKKEETGLSIVQQQLPLSLSL